MVRWMAGEALASIRFHHKDHEDPTDAEIKAALLDGPKPEPEPEPAQEPIDENSPDFPF